MQLWERVRSFERRYLLTGPRSERFLERHASASAPLDRAGIDAAELVFPDGLGHACQASGGCCSGTDVGPLPEGVVARIGAHAWEGLLPTARTSLFRRATLDGQPIVLMGSRDGACTFQRADKLCAVHAELGVAAKPAICRQFPYLFTRTPDGRVATAIQMECRAYLRAKRASVPLAAEEASLRELLRVGAFVQHVREPVELSAGLPASWAEYLALEAALVDAFDASAPIDGAEAARAVLSDRLALLDTELGGQSPHLDPAAWARALGGDVTAEVSPAQRLAQLRDRLLDAIADSRVGYVEAGELLRVDLHDRLAHICRATLGGSVDPSLYVDREGALRQVLADMWRSSIAAKAPLQLPAFDAGVGRLHLEMALVRAGAALAARASARVEIAETDAVDSMVVVNKMLRQTALSGLLRRCADTLTGIFVERPGLFGVDTRSHGGSREQIR
jgi:Fe-S-cluster containining protein